MPDDYELSEKQRERAKEIWRKYHERIGEGSEEAVRLASQLFAADGIVVDATRAKEAPCKCYSVNREKMCYDGKTEILTSMGFKPIPLVDYSDRVATLNPKTGEIEYQNPVDFQSFRYSGKMVHFNGRGYDLMVTPEHSHFYHNGKGRLRKVEEIYEKLASFSRPDSAGIKFYRGGEWKGNDPTCFILEGMNHKYKTKSLEWERPGIIEKAKKLYEEKESYEKVANTLGIGKTTVARWIRGEATKKYASKSSPKKEIDLDIWLKFFGWWVTEGYTYDAGGGNYWIGISQTSEDNIEYLREMKYLVDEMGYNYFESNGKIKFLDKQLFSYLSQFGKSPERFLPGWMKNLSQERLRILVDTMMKGDGSKDEKIFYTTSKRLADDFQEILLKSGLTGSIGVDDRKSKDRPLYRVTVADSKDVLVSKKPKLVPYDGFVYDLTVPEHHIIMTRRNGKITWSGNCFSKGIIGTLSDAQEKKYCPSIRKKHSKKLKKHLKKAEKWFKKTKGMPLAERLKVLKEKLHH